MNSAIELKNVTFSYPKKQIYQELSLSFDANKITYIMGNNGCGKTTLLKLICRFLDQQSGQILVSGKDSKEYSQNELSKQISYVPQSIKQNIDYSVKDYLAMGRSPYIKFGLSPSKADFEIVEKYAEKLGICDILISTFNELSGGQKQVVAITKALIQETPIIVMDEPMSALDIGKQAEILILINQLITEGKTIILTSHNPNHALLTNCKVCLINEGQVISYGLNKNVLTPENLEKVYGKNVKLDKTTNSVYFNLEE